MIRRCRACRLNTTARGYLTCNPCRGIISTHDRKHMKALGNYIGEIAGIEVARAMRK